ncbi:hypothetical protein PsorP6_006568 [Peronosclerospora sorghi]|uniref:Uncharacterized protein n=1 Tax=Peronosclerospora sorghi TaxID=230839 RepID=A0ACC0W6B1_9STRA|nr:hypothetical protein PsorP6_006568 [Peronosclerospora sorghi]
MRNGMLTEVLCAIKLDLWLKAFAKCMTYSPVSSLNPVRAFLALICQRGYAILQLDVEPAFLNV